MTNRERVKVTSGDELEELGLGYLVGFVPVYFWRAGAGSLISQSMCEERPSDEIIAEMEADGATLVELQSNPKIELDNGRTVYGCQVYWRRVSD